MNCSKVIVAIASVICSVSGNVEAQGDQKIVMTCDYLDPSNPYLFVLDFEHKRGDVHHQGGRTRGGAIDSDSNWEFQIARITDEEVAWASPTGAIFALNRYTGAIAVTYQGQRLAGYTCLRQQKQF